MSALGFSLDANATAWKWTPSGAAVELAPSLEVLTAARDAFHDSLCELRMGLAVANEKVDAASALATPLAVDTAVTPAPALPPLEVLSASSPPPPHRELAWDPRQAPLPFEPPPSETRLSQAATAGAAWALPVDVSPVASSVHLMPAMGASVSVPAVAWASIAYPRESDPAAAAAAATAAPPLADLSYEEVVRFIVAGREDELPGVRRVSPGLSAQVAELLLLPLPLPELDESAAAADQSVPPSKPWLDSQLSFGAGSAADAGLLLEGPESSVCAASAAPATACRTPAPTPASPAIGPGSSGRGDDASRRSRLRRPSRASSWSGRASASEGSVPPPSSRSPWLPSPEQTGLLRARATSAPASTPASARGGRGGGAGGIGGGTLYSALSFASPDPAKSSSGRPPRPPTAAGTSLTPARSGAPRHPASAQSPGQPPPSPSATPMSRNNAGRAAAASASRRSGEESETAASAATAATPSHRMHDTGSPMGSPLLPPATVPLERYLEAQRARQREGSCGSTSATDVTLDSHGSPVVSFKQRGGGGGARAGALPVVGPPLEVVDVGGSPVPRTRTFREALAVAAALAAEVEEGGGK